MTTTTAQPETDLKPDGDLLPDTNPNPDGDLRVVGKPLPRVDAVGKLTGATAYADDIELPGTLFVKILRSPHPHARVLSVDTSSASCMAGVAAVITGHDLPTKYGIMPTTQDERALEDEKVRFVGDPVAAVAAVDEETALAACRAIRVEYEPLETIGSIEPAVRRAPPRLRGAGQHPPARRPGVRGG
jgi:4-hydroxybenzoyl-CoA reductase subunit alpha